VAKEENQYTLVTPKSKTSKTIVTTGKLPIAVGVGFFVASFLISHSLVVGIIFGVAVGVALILSADKTRAKVTDIQAVITYAQTVFPLLTSAMSNTSVAERASVALPPKMRAEMANALQEANTSNLSMRDAMLLFAAKVQSQEVDVVMAVVAASFSASSEGFRRSSGEVVVKLFQQALEQISATIRARQDVVLAGKLVIFGAPGIYLLLESLVGSSIPASSSLLLFSALAVGVIVIASAFLSSIVGKPIETHRLIEDAILEKQLLAKTAVVEDSL
jgi:hypothetical protein